MRYLAGLLVLASIVLAARTTQAADNPARADVQQALRKATEFLHGSIADHGGYAWVSSPDGKHREGEGLAGPGTIWVQPPGTPAIGLAFLEAFEATGDAVHRKAAQDAATALVQGQLRSGGWNYRIEFDPKSSFTYRRGADGNRIPPTPAPGGWDVWKLRRFKGDITVLDDDTTPAALRFLMRFDRFTDFKNKPVHDAVTYALGSVMNAQYPIGAWSHNYDRFPLQAPAEDHYPVKPASFPEEWSRTWTRDWTGCYMLNDRITPNMIRTLLLAYRIYGDRKFQVSAERGGRFLRLAQMPDPQPAWAQQYDRHMRPVWDRKFEPPAITGLESQDVLDVLLDLYRETGNRDYLEPVPPALAYLKKCVLGDGQLARFYELRTNRPLYCTRDYQLTYDAKEVPAHYRFTGKSRLEEIQARYRQLEGRKEKDLSADPPARLTDAVRESVRRILGSQNASGAWLEPGTVRDATGARQKPAEGVVRSQTFIDNMTTLTRYLQATR